MSQALRTCIIDPQNGVHARPQTMISVSLIAKHKRTSIYTKRDFVQLLVVVKDLNNLIVLPNIRTEADNLLNTLSGNYKWPYIEKVKSVSRPNF